MDFFEAIQRIGHTERKLESEWVYLDRALGRITSKVIHAPNSIPPFRASRWDGFAIHSEDTLAASEHNPVALGLLEDIIITAGSRKHVNVPLGTCAKIMTGGAIPPDCDTVVKQEDVKEAGGKILFAYHIDSGEGIIESGDIIKRGDVLVEAHTLITPYRLYALADSGVVTVPVFRRPRIAFMAIGDELSMPGEVPKPFQRYAGGKYYLSALAENLIGAQTVNLGVVKDDPQEIKEAITSCLDVHLLVTTGGTGHGVKDYIELVWQDLNVSVLFRSLPINLGASSKGGPWKEIPWLALPGVGSSGIVVFVEVLNKIAKTWYGWEKDVAIKIPAHLMDDVTDNNQSKVHCGFLGYIEWKGEETLFHPIKKGKRQDINGYILIPSMETIPKLGDKVLVTTLMAYKD